MVVIPIGDLRDLRENRFMGIQAENFTEVQRSEGVSVLPMEWVNMLMH